MTEPRHAPGAETERPAADPAPDADAEPTEDTVPDEPDATTAPHQGDETVGMDRDDHPTDAAGNRRPRVWTLLPWVLLVLALGAATVSTLQLLEHRSAEATRDDVERAAGTFMLTLTSWDAVDGMGPVREELRAAGTDRFAGEVDELFGTTEDLAGLADIGARSEGEVRRLFVQEIDDDRATALVVIVQRLSSDLSDEEEINVRYAEVRLLERGGTWLVDDVELLVDQSEQAPGGVSPSTAPGTDDGTDDIPADDADEEAPADDAGDATEDGA